MSTTVHETYNDARIDILCRPLFDKCLEELEKRLTGSLNPERIQALVSLANTANLGIDWDSKANRIEIEARADRCRRVFAKAILKAQEHLKEEHWDTETIEALAGIADAAACGLSGDQDANDLENEYGEI
jgi:hypothetical protein